MLKPNVIKIKILFNLTILAELLVIAIEMW